MPRYLVLHGCNVAALMFRTVIVVILLGVFRRLLTFHVGRKMGDLDRLRRVTDQDVEAGLLVDKANGGKSDGYRKTVSVFSFEYLSCGAQIVTCHTLAFTIAYLNMLIAMTYNVGLFVSVMLGEALGFTIFSSGLICRSSSDSDRAHCH